MSHILVCVLFYAYRLYFVMLTNSCDMYTSCLRHIHDPVLSSLKMEGTRSIFFFFCNFAIRPNINICTLFKMVDEGSSVLWRDNKHRLYQ
jgi:hypothetical protein